MPRVSQIPGPLAGEFIDGTHVFPVRVYFEDTDTGGIVYHANYLKFMERARTEILRACGFEQSASMADGGAGYAVRACQIDFMAPARLDDVLEVRSTLAKVGAAYLDARQDIWRGDEPLTEATVRAVCINGKGAPMRHPRAMLDQMTERLTLSP